MRWTDERVARLRFAGLLVGFSVLVSACGDSAGPTGSAGATGATGTTSAGATRPLELGDAADTPAVDRSRSIVDVGSVVFDTFDGGSVALPDADDALIERLFDAIAPIDGPGYETVDSADVWLVSDDVVIGYVDPQGAAWAYAVRILNFHEIVNDELGGQPVLVSYCPLCGSGVVYDRVLGDRPLSFSNTSALYENDLVMVDRETGTYWWQVPGRAIVGDLSGEALEALVSETTTWGRWRDRHPTTMVMARPPGRDYSRDPFASYPGRVDAGMTPFPVDEAAMKDERLSASAPVVIAEIDGSFRAWSSAESRTVTERVGDALVEVTTDGVGGTVLVDGVPAPVRTTMWFAAVAAYPDIVLGG